MTDMETYDPVTQEIRPMCRECFRHVQVFTMNQWGEIICKDCEWKAIAGVRRRLMAILRGL